MALSKTALFYRKNKKSRDKKKAYDTKFHSTEERKNYRAELNREGHKRGIYGKRDSMNKDLHHKKGGGLVLIDSEENRGKREKSRLKGSKRNKFKSLYRRK